MLELRKRWLAFGVLCLGTLMIVLDSTIVNVALPSIRLDLGFSESSLAWVVNAYLLTFGGFLLLSGRLGDIFGHRRMFIIGLVIFCTASLLCGLAPSQSWLVSARAVQGFGGAIVSAVGLSLMMNLFTENEERAKAMGVYGFVAAGGGSVGVLLGGLLTGSLNWHWIFFVNIPIGIVVLILSMKLLPARDRAVKQDKHVDIAGAASVTASLLLAVYAIVNGNSVGWLSAKTVGMLVAALLLFSLFIYLEKHLDKPLVQLSLFHNRNLTVANGLGVLWAAAMFAWFFLSALYMQLILHYSPLRVGLAFLPANLIMAAFSIGLSAKLVEKFGIKKPLSLGLVLAGLGLMIFAFSPVNGGFLLHVLPGMLIIGIGAGMGFNPVLLAAMDGIRPSDSGLASGLVNTSFLMGGALGLAILASVAAARTTHLTSQGFSQLAALNGGYHAAFIVGACSAALAGILGWLLLKPTSF
jgi:EmrB/QacA subfamily drug resistance transporter